MTLTDCQLLSIVAQLGTFAAAAERMHITPSAVSHAVSGVEAECGFPLFTRTKSGVTLTAAAEKLMPAIQQMLASSESLEQSLAQINGMHKGALRLGVFNSACVTWLPKIVPGFRAAFPGIDVQIYQGSYDDITGWLKTGAVELGFLSNSSAHDLDFEPLYDDRLICIAPPDYKPRRPGVVRAEELRGQPFVSQQSDVDADIQSYFKKNDLHVSSQCYIVDDQSMIAMVACGQGLALMPELMFKEGAASAGCQVLQLEPAAKRSIGLACLSRGALSPAAKEFVSLESRHAVLHVLDGGVGLDLAVQGIGKTGSLQQVGDFLGDAELDQIRVRADESLFVAAGGQFGNDVLDSAVAVVRDRVQNNTICHRIFSPLNISALGR